VAGRCGESTPFDAFTAFRQGSCKNCHANSYDIGRGRNMSPAEIIERATEEGVLLALSPSGSISAKGDQ